MPRKSSLMSGVWKRSPVDETEPPRHTSTLLPVCPQRGSGVRPPQSVPFDGGPTMRETCTPSAPA